MVIRHEVEGYENFIKLVKEVKEKKPENIFILFSGSPNTSGKSWCPDCVVADPVIEKALSSASENSHFMHVRVGERNVWKDPNNPFRKDAQLRLTSVPTILRFGEAERLEEADCAKIELVTMLLEA